MAIAHDVRTYMRARAMKELEFFCLMWLGMDLLNNLGHSANRFLSSPLARSARRARDLNLE